MKNVVSLAIVLTCLASQADAQTNVTVSGFKVKVNGQDFAFKGVNYSPVPIANSPSYAPYGDYFTAPFSNVWGYDIDRMREMGANTIKLYAGNPGLNAGAPGSAGNWKPFLDKLWNGGNKPIRVMMTSYVQGGDIAAGGAVFQQYKNDWTNLVASTASHPAVLGYTVGNEIYSPSVNNNPTFWQNYGQLVDVVHNTAAGQGKDPLITTAINDALEAVPGFGNTWEPIVRGQQSGHLQNLDAWAINIYRGAEFGGTGPNNAFDQYQALMGQLGVQKPMIVGEFGIQHSTRPEGIYGTTNTANPVELGNGQPWITGAPNNGDPTPFMTRMLNTLYGDLDDGAGQVAVGGYVFSYADEYWKGDPSNPVPPSTHVGGPDGAFQHDAFPGGYWDEAWFGLSSSLDPSVYTNNQLPVSRTFFPAYYAVQNHFDDTSHLGSELYVVPEPSTLGLLGIASATMLLWRKRGAKVGLSA